jgi:hypothetical protein
MWQVFTVSTDSSTQREHFSTAEMSTTPLCRFQSFRTSVEVSRIGSLPWRLISYIRTSLPWDFQRQHYFISTNIAYIWFFLLEIPKHLHAKEDYLIANILQWHLQYRYITRWTTTNGNVEEGVLLEGSHSSAGYGSVVLCIFGVLQLMCNTSFYTHGRNLHENLQLFSSTALL